MISYKDQSYCLWSTKGCSDKDCLIYLTREDQKKAEEMEIPVNMVNPDKPECYR